ncbi:MAG TPA: hypothetical protein VGI76_07900 [Solirubrobacteraceae bacterium]
MGTALSFGEPATRTRTRAAGCGEDYRDTPAERATRLPARAREPVDRL